MLLIETIVMMMIGRTFSKNTSKFLGLKKFQKNSVKKSFIFILCKYFLYLLCEWPRILFSLILCIQITRIDTFSSTALLSFVTWSTPCYDLRATEYCTSPVQPPGALTMVLNNRQKPIVSLAIFLINLKTVLSVPDPVCSNYTSTDYANVFINCKQLFELINSSCFSV